MLASQEDCNVTGGTNKRTRQFWCW